MAEISKGSFYQYFKSKNDYYWYIVMLVFNAKTKTYETLLENYDGDFIDAERELFVDLTNALEDEKYSNLVKYAFSNTFIELQTRLTDSANVIFFEMYDLLMKYGFKKYQIKSKEDFLVIFDMIRSIANQTIIRMISENLSARQAIELYDEKIKILKRGIDRKVLGIF